MSCALCQMPREDPSKYLCDACRELSEAGAGLISLPGSEETEQMAYTAQWEHLDGQTVFVVVIAAEVLPGHANAARDAALESVIASLGGTKVSQGRSDSNNGGN